MRDASIVLPQGTPWVVLSLLASDWNYPVPDKHPQMSSACRLKSAKRQPSAAASTVADSCGTINVAEDSTSNLTYSTSHTTSHQNQEPQPLTGQSRSHSREKTAPSGNASPETSSTALTTQQVVSVPLACQRQLPTGCWMPWARVSQLVR